MGIVVRYNGIVVGYRIYVKTGIFNSWTFKTYWFLNEAK